MGGITTVTQPPTVAFALAVAVPVPLLPLLLLPLQVPSVILTLSEVEWEGSRRNHPETTYRIFEPFLSRLCP